MSLGRWSVLIPIGTLFRVCTPAMGQSQPSHRDNSLPSTNFSADGTVDRSGL
jgi:hypothetical protein